MPHPEFHYDQIPLGTRYAPVEQGPVLALSVASHDVWAPKGVDDIPMVVGHVRMTIKVVLPFPNRNLHNIAAS